MGEPVASAIAMVRWTASTSPMTGALALKFLMERPAPLSLSASCSCASARME
jgi:hypothetical protein